jgi:hypothetical protein
LFDITKASEADVNAFMTDPNIIIKVDGMFFKDPVLAVLYNDKKPLERGLGKDHILGILDEQLSKAQGQLIAYKLEQQYWSFKDTLRKAGDPSQDTIAKNLLTSNNNVNSTTEQIQNIQDMMNRVEKDEKVI